MNTQPTPTVPRKGAIHGNTAHGTACHGLAAFTSTPPAAQFFNRDLLSEEQANEMWHRCIRVIDVANEHRQTPGILRLKHMHVQLNTLYDARGRLVRFWLRTVIGNQLVIVGNRGGLLPLNVEAIYGRR